MKLWNWFFPSKPVKQALAALDELEPLFSADLAFDEVRRRLRKNFIEHPEHVYQVIQKEGIPPRSACLMAMVKITRDDLAYGRDYVYRGMLNMVGESKRSIYNIAMRELEKAGVCTAEVRRMRAQELDEDIREAG